MPDCIVIQHFDKCDEMSLRDFGHVPRYSSRCLKASAYWWWSIPSCSLRLSKLFNVFEAHSFTIHATSFAQTTWIVQRCVRVLTIFQSLKSFSISDMLTHSHRRDAIARFACLKSCHCIQSKCSTTCSGVVKLCTPRSWLHIRWWMISCWFM